jgi:hypothetical protein
VDFLRQAALVRDGSPPVPFHRKEHTMTADLPRIGTRPKVSLRPQEELILGLLDVVGELAGMLVAKGVFTATELRLVMENRQRICFEQVSAAQSIPARTVAECAAIWEKPAALAFPKDAQVLPFVRPGDPTTAQTE